MCAGLRPQGPRPSPRPGSQQNWEPSLKETGPWVHLREGDNVASGRESAPGQPPGRRAPLIGPKR